MEKNKAKNWPNQKKCTKKQNNPDKKIEKNAQKRE